MAEIQSRRQSIKDRLAEKIKENRGKLSSGIDPSILKDLIDLGATYIEEGIVKAKDFVARMRADMKELGIDDSTVTDKEITEQIFDKTQKGVKKDGEVKKTIVTVRAYEGDFREGVKRELEERGLTRKIENQQEAKQKALKFIESVGEETDRKSVV